MIIREGSTPSVTIEGDPKKIHAIHLDQQGDQLVLSKKNSLANTDNVLVYVTVSDLRIIEIHDDAHVQSATTLGGDLLWVKLAGNGEVNLETNARKVLTTSWANGKICIHGDYQSCSTYRSESGKLVTAYTKETSAAISQPEN